MVRRVSPLRRPWLFPENNGELFAAEYHTRQQQWQVLKYFTSTMSDSMILMPLCLRLCLCNTLSSAAVPEFLNYYHLRTTKCLYFKLLQCAGIHFHTSILHRQPENCICEALDKDLYEHRDQ